MDLSALALNCTLKKSDRVSNTQALLDRVGALFDEHGVAFDTIRIIDHHVPHGVSADEGDGDEWPAIFERIKAADILVIGTPIWFGVRSSVCQKVIERLDASYDEADPATGQFPLYGKVAGVVVTGNEDGAHDAASNTLFNLSHLGCTDPAQRRHVLGRRSGAGTVLHRGRRRTASLHEQDESVHGREPRVVRAVAQGEPDPHEPEGPLRPGSGRERRDFAERPFARPDRG